MMNKIIQVINVMISNAQKVTNVIVNKEDEFFFIYNKNHKWSITEDENDGSVSLFLYPDEQIKLEELAFETDYGVYKKFVAFSSDDFKSKELTESFVELMNLVKNKIYGVDDILDEILKE